MLARQCEPHHFPIRIYYEDTDAGGVVVNDGAVAGGRCRESALLAMLDSAVVELQNAGVIDSIIAAYAFDRTILLRPNPPFETPSHEENKL